MRKYFGLLAATGLATVPVLSLAAGPTLSDVLVSSGISAAGYVDGSYEATFNSTDGATKGAVPLHQFDTNANSFMLNQAGLTLSYLPTAGFGAAVNLIAGEDAKVINGAYGDGSGDFALTQGYVQYAVGNLTVIGGRFVTLAGEEVIDDTKNSNVSRSLLFTNVEPLVHTGVRASYKFNDQFTGTLGVNNTALGGSVGQDADKQKTAEFGLAYTPTSAISVSLADYYGVDNASAFDFADGTQVSKNTKNNYLDLVASWQATSALQFALNGDYARSIGATSTFPSLFEIATATPPYVGSDSVTGVATYVNYSFNDRWKASLRAESLYAKASSDTGDTAGVHVSELTLTGDYSASKSFDVLAEGRVDYASDFTAADAVGDSVSTPVFPGGNDNAGRKSQPEILLKAIYKFGTPASS